MGSTLKKGWTAHAARHHFVGLSKAPGRCRKGHSPVGLRSYPPALPAGQVDGVTCKISAFGRLLVDCICFLGKWFRHNFATLNFTKAIENRRHLRIN